MIRLSAFMNYWFWLVLVQDGRWCLTWELLRSRLNCITQFYLFATKYKTTICIVNSIVSSVIWKKLSTVYYSFSHLKIIFLFKPLMSHVELCVSMWNSHFIREKFLYYSIEMVQFHIKFYMWNRICEFSVSDKYHSLIVFYFFVVLFRF